MQPDEAFYSPESERRFVATAWTRGPWHPGLQHGGPPAALLLRAMERAADAEGAFQLARLTVEFLRPAPIGAVEVELERTRPGRKALGYAATLLAEGRPTTRAHGLFVRRAELEIPPELRGPAAPDDPERHPRHVFSFFGEPVGYHAAVDVRLETGPFGPGQGAAWLRMRGRLVAGEDPTPAQRVVVAADAINGVGFALDFARYTFVNADLTIYLHRAPEGPFVRLAATHVSRPSGVGVVDAVLSDVRGPIGRALESQVVEARTSAQP